MRVFDFLLMQVMNHGITKAFLDKIYKLTKEFCALPSEEKQKYARDIGSIQGYGNDMILWDDQVLDWIDRLYITTYPEDQRQLKETLHEYTMKQHLVIKQVFKAMARSLELEENCFLDMCGENATMDTRFNMYPPCPRPDKVIGVKPHADKSAFTLLFPDKNVEGLQFLKDGKWYKAPIVSADTILINVGDQMEIMSNGIYKSPVHRVVTNREKERISVATFFIPGADKEIQPVNGLVSEARPRLYKPVKNYVKLLNNYYLQGLRPIAASLI
ncbi:Oxoglutarate/iron-dependent dioxygenase [Arabidopsis thaliana x Arabidopsis arenosa]|uniref:Oxoglutarate/iron-dependent dioxygenase n=1 Tax=Arabidopsis thaliana x Arabidopsis arenosa TaxID=1240361 RepID=A0A8T1YZC9_9BRAS|nr:Oxoglutarate/iron-dependent dioxygenase [Arabidopsis thaliana x Arabidopsis arenosa]